MCQYCEIDKDGYMAQFEPDKTKSTPQRAKSFICNSYLYITAFRTRTVMSINYRPMCGRKLKEETL